jgi:hypothetical protein
MLPPGNAGGAALFWATAGEAISEAMKASATTVLVCILSDPSP